MHPFETDGFAKGFTNMSDFTANGGLLATRSTPSLARVAKRTWDAITTPVRAYLQREAVYRELTDLDDRMLADIGLNRGDVFAVASGLRRPNGQAPRGKAAGLTDII